jgi:hypothetical protein
VTSGVAKWAMYVADSTSEAEFLKALEGRIPLDHTRVEFVPREEKSYVPLLGRDSYLSTASGGYQYQVLDGDNGYCTSAAPWYWTNGSNVPIRCDCRPLCEPGNLGQSDQ